MTLRWAPLGSGVALLLTSCASALREPPPLTTLTASATAAAVAPGPAGAGRLLEAAEATFAHRPDVAAVRKAREQFLAAVRADETQVEGLLGAARASAWLVEHERDAAARSTLAAEAVQLCQWCHRLAPERVDCVYRLALALGQQARERPSTGADALPRIVAFLEQVIAADPLLDNAGGHRVLALVLLRAPGWPAGPGDPEAGLEHARAADELVADFPPNKLVLAEALAATGDVDQARRVYLESEEIAASLAARGDSDAGEWTESATRALRSLR